MKKERKVGLTVLVAIALFYALVSWGTGTGFWQEDGHEVVFHFEEVDGLLEGDPIDIRGYESGKIMEIRPMASYIYVKAILYSETPILEDAYAEIRMKELMGGKQIALFPGANGRPLPPETPIPGRQVLDFSTAFVRIDELSQSLDFASLQALVARLDTLSRLATQWGQALSVADGTRTLKHLASASEGLDHALQDLNRSQLIGRLDHSLNQLDELTLAAKGTLSQTDTLLASVAERTLPYTDSVLVKMLDMITETEQSIQAANQLFAQLKSTDNAMGKLLNDPQWAATMDSTVHNLNKTLEHLRTKKIHVAMSLSAKSRVYKE